MRQRRWVSIIVVVVLVGALLLAHNCLSENQAEKEVTQLFPLAIPPESTCMSNPYVSGVGNNPRNCRSASLECVIGSGLSQQEIQDYYARQLGTGWVSADTRDSGTLAWRKAGATLDEMVVVEYEPKYLPPDSQPGQELQEARQRHTTAYLLTVMANKCTGPFP